MKLPEQKKIIKNDIAYHFCPPGTHQHNAFKQSIQTYKNHFITGILSKDPNLPLQVRDGLILHAEIALN